MFLAYCDYIADRISKALNLDIKENPIYTYIAEVGPTKLDLHPEHGHFMSSTKTIKVVDKNGKTYTITVTEDI
jgi:hypothetical protein